MSKIGRLIKVIELPKPGQRPTTPREQPIQVPNWPIKKPQDAPKHANQ